MRRQRLGEGIRFDTAEAALAGQAGLRDGRGAMARRKVAASGVPIPSTSRRAISSVPGGKRGKVRSRDHHRLPPGTELIGLRQVDGMAQREPCRGVGANPERTPSFPPSRADPG